MRKTFLQALKSDAAVAEHIRPEAWFSRGSLTERPKTFPFAVVAFSVADPGLSSVRRHAVDVWVHDELGSYVRIDEALDAIEKCVAGMTHVQGETAEIMAGEFQMRSADLEDDGLRTLTRTSSFLLVGKIR